MTDKGGLPDSWLLPSLRDLCESLTYGLSVSADAGAAGTRFLRITDINEFYIVDWTTVPGATEAALVKSEHLRLRNGDLVFARTGSLDKTHRVRGNPDAVFASYLIRARPLSAMLSPWLEFWSRSPLYTRATWHAAAGVGRPNINASKLGAFQVPLAPLGEQQRIVAEIEKQFTRLDEAVASLKAVQAKLKRARASVLKAAVEGRLVPTEAELARAEGRSYEPASVLLERILAERRTRWPKGKRYQPPAGPKTDDLPELPDGWAWAGLDSLLLEIQAGRSFSCGSHAPGPDGVGVVKVSAVTWGTYDEAESKTCSDQAMVNRNYFIRPGDFLFSRANTIELVGACVIVEQTTRTIMLSDKILRLAFVSTARPRWVLHVLRSHHGRREIEALSTGNQESMRNIGQDRIRCIALPLPPAVEQTRIVAEVERRLSVIDNLEQTVEQNLARCARLRQSILKRAFEGKLVPQDPSDEPASQLVARIRAQRAAEARA